MMKVKKINFIKTNVEKKKNNLSQLRLTRLTCYLEYNIMITLQKKNETNHETQARLIFKISEPDHEIGIARGRQTRKNNEANFLVIKN
jgi:hypothetical protein